MIRSHSTAFPVSSDLASVFAAEVNAQPPTLSFVQVHIQDETLVLGQKGSYVSEPTEAFASVAAAASDDQPSYFAVRDPGSTAGKWILVMFVPDLAKVKQRMLYAATRDTLKRALGYDNFSREALCSLRAELEWSFIQDVVGQGSQAEVLPLTQLEIQATEERLLATDSHRDAKTKGMIVFPLTTPALDAIKEFAAGSKSFVQLILNSQEETIDLSSASNIATIEDTRGSMSSEHPSYNLFRFNHTDPTTSTETEKTFLFLWCPSTAAAKQKMLSATLKRAVSQILEQHLTVHKQFDSDDLSELAHEALLSLLYSNAVSESATEAKSVARPSRPGKGGRKMIGGSRKELDDDDE